MSNKVNHNKCPVCRKKFTRYRHSVVKRVVLPYVWHDRYSGIDSRKRKNNRIEYNKIVTVCGCCKDDIVHGRRFKWGKWCNANNINPENAVIFDTDKKIKAAMNPRKFSVNRKSFRAYWDKGRGSDKNKWRVQHEEVLRKCKDPKYQKIWTNRELFEFDKLLKQEEAEIMGQLEAELNKPLLEWLQ